MTHIEDGWPPWIRFQARIKTAVSRAADQHETVGNLLIDLETCEMFLRLSENPTDKLDEFDSPVSNRLLAALETHAADDSVEFDEVCTANVVLALRNAISNEATGNDH